MTNHDAAFLWESSVLRERRGRRTRPSIPLSPGWVTLREAHRATGVPIDTLRKWGRQGSVPSMVVETEAGLRRLVRLESVIGRAEHQGRTVPGATSGKSEARPQADDTSETVATEATPPPPEDSAPPASAAAPEGSMIVPIEAWDRMLMQLGNLHEAGQQLAEARERAARAETEAEFLRERLGELRKPPTAPPAVDEHDRAAEPANPSEAKRPGRDADGKSLPTEPVWEYAVRRWRLRRGR
ncbi:MAG TPA: hypothetical protein VLG28_10060 [Acidimicrobiia bacterium]|jgi:hypothetical protein|nr:hypothetical protein [Acidimicrobiia bacterium]